MAQSVNLWGATYSDVPAIEVPKSGGGLASFTDVTDTTAVASDVAQGKYFFTASGQLTLGTASGGGGSVTQDQDGYIVLPSTGGGSPSATQHTIHLEFSDSTDTDIDVYYDDSLIGTMITAYEPSTWTYSSKTVYVAELDGVEWYNATPSPVSWETIWDNNISYNKDNDNDYPYCWITGLASVQIPQGSEWRVTYNSVTYNLTAVYDQAAFSGYGIGNPKWSKGTDNGSNAPFCFTLSPWGAWTGSLNAPNSDASYYFKIERQVTS